MKVLVQGLTMFGVTVFFQDDNSLFTKVVVQDVLLDWDENMLKEMLQPFGEFIRAEPLKHIIDGKVSAWDSGAWLAFMSKVHTVLPAVIEYKIEMKTYRVRLSYEVQQQQQAVNVPNNPPNVNQQPAPVIKNCGMCGGSDHFTRDCRLQVPVCFTCKQQDHTTRDCPENEGAKVVDKCYIYYSLKCPLSNWNVEYPFSVGHEEYICIEQRVQKEKCDMFGDISTAEKIMEETDPQKMRKIGENVRNYKHSEWMGCIDQVTYDANKAKFSDRRAAGARECLLSTGNRIIGEASTNMKWGTGLKVSDRNACDPKSWIGENMSGIILMDIRDNIIKSQPPPARNDQNLSTTASSSPVDSSEAGLNMSMSDIQSVDLHAVLIGDHNTQKLSLDDGHIKTKILSFSDKSSLTEIRQSILNGSVDAEVQNHKVKVVALHVGSGEWRDPEAGVTKAIDAYHNLVKLMNVCSGKLESPELVVSSVPLLKLSDNPTPAEIQACEEIKNFNLKVHDLGESESNVHYVDNSLGICTNNKLLSLHDGINTLNERGLSVLSDNLRNGIRSCFVESVQSGWQVA